MFIKHLYIIGNGFDLHHGINSSYKDFRDWLYNNHKSLYEHFNDIYDDCGSVWWSDFENSLALLNVDKYAQSMGHKHKPNYSSEKFEESLSVAELEADNKLTMLIKDLRNCFREWVMQLQSPITSKSIRLIVKDSAFLNFNYTNTLQDLYRVNKCSRCVVKHIHGSINDKENAFVLGHGKSKDDIIKMNKGKNENNLCDTGEEYTYNDSSKEIHVQFARTRTIEKIASLKKDVKQIMEKNDSFFKALFNVLDVHVYGLSFSEVDLPYLEHIAEIIRDAKWEFSYFSLNDIKRIIRFCYKNKICRIKVTKLENLIEDRQLNIPFR